MKHPYQGEKKRKKRKLDVESTLMARTTKQEAMHEVITNDGLLYSS